MKAEKLIEELFKRDIDKEIVIQDGCMLTEIRSIDISETDNKIIIQK